MTGPCDENRAELLVRGIVVTQNAVRQIISDGAVAVAGDKIVAVGPWETVSHHYPEARRLGGEHQIVLPGMVDSHTHPTQSLLRGLIGGELPMIYRLYLPADQALSPDDAYTAARLTAAQLAKSGISTVCAFETNVSPEQEDAVLQGIAEVGLRCNFLRSWSDQDSHHAALYSQITDKSWRRRSIGKAEKDLQRTEELLHRYANDQMVFIGVCPSGLTGFSDEYFRLAHSLAQRENVRMHVHAARDREEVEFCLSVFGRRPIEQLAKLGVVDHHLVVVHGMLASSNEIALLGGGRSALAHSAVEVANVLAHVPDIPAMRRAGIRVGLGCDNAVNDMFIVMHSAWLMHTATRGIALYQPDIMREENVFAMATDEAANVLGLETQIGSLEAGKGADLVVLDGATAHLGPTQDLIPEIVRCGSRAEVRLVMVAGRVIVEDGMLISLDFAALRAKAAEIAARLKPLVMSRRYTPLSDRRRLCC